MRSDRDGGPLIGFIFARDELPKAFWVKPGTSWSEGWTPDDPQYLSNAMFKWTWDKPYVTHIESVLLSAPSLHAQRPIALLREERDDEKPNTSDSKTPVQDHSDEEAGESGEADDYVSVRTFSGKWERQLVTEAFGLLNLYAGCQFGVVFQLVNHPAGRLAFVPYIWSTDDVNA